MKTKFNGLLLLLLGSLVAVGYGVYRTDRRAVIAQTPAQRRYSGQGLVVDQSSLTTAVRLVRMPTSADERSFAQDALQLADQEMDLAFAQAVRATANHPAATTPEAKDASSRLTDAERALGADSAQVADVTAQVAHASGSKADELNDRLDLAKAQLALDDDQVDDAKADLIRAGGDPQARMQEMIAEHNEASAASDSVRVNVAPTLAPRGLIGLINALQAAFSKESDLKVARGSADSLATAFKQRHDRLEARAGAAVTASGAAGLSHDSSTALLATTRRRALDEKSRATLDQRVDNQHRLSDAYTGWIGVVVAQETMLMNAALRGLGAILAIILVGMLLALWVERLVGARSLDRRRTQTLYMVTRVSLQVAAVLLILLVIFGPPDNIGTFLGLAGAGLTVALKDFIMAFVGWFILMGKNGIRIGDLVEINDVTGEVVDLGIFYTVLLETGNWNESGHLTGRRVSFTNGFAIEGHYFNFSTSGQWLWDEVRVVVPKSQDPYPVVEALQRQADEATSDNARQAAEQWKASRRSPHFGSPATAPSVNLKPVGDGVEITLRYITSVAERAELRASLYRAAVDLLGGGVAAGRTPVTPPRAAPAAR